MANLDCPNGFYAIGSLEGKLPQEFEGLVQSSSGAIAIGDPLFQANGYIRVATANDGQLIGVSNCEVPVSTTEVQKVFFYGAPDTMFEGQCSGTLTQAMIWERCDIEGSTGIFEINENATTEDVVQILGLMPYDNNAVGANAKVKFIIKRHQLGNLAEDK